MTIPNKTISCKQHQRIVPAAILLLLWCSTIVFINPVGEFMINDDWSFTLIVEDLLDGNKITSTGWGGGGPSIFTHISWGLIFSLLFGYSITTLRISVLFLACSSSFALLHLLHHMGASRWLALWATMTLVFNPLFLSQSFTFMTDITFVSMVIFSLFFLHMGVENKNQTLLVFGLLFALLSILTRQLGLVIPLGFVAALYLHPKGTQFNKNKILLLTICIAIAPWLAYEAFLWATGSTPVTSHPVVQRILLYPKTKGFPDYFFFLSSQVGIICMYSAFLVSPLLVLHSSRLVKQKLFKPIAGVLIASFCFFELLLMSKLINPPAVFYKNIISNFGIGPILLKDNYLLNMQRSMALPKPLFYLLVFCALIAAMTLLFFIIKSTLQFLKNSKNTSQQNLGFTSFFALLCAIFYSGIILLTGFHDRYLIPVCLFLIIWFVNQLTRPVAIRHVSIFFSAVLLFFFAGTSVVGTRDFMSTKRSQHEAHQYILNQLHVAPCDIDGGFEYNGYYCSNQNSGIYDNKYSWWWVKQEKYLISLGTLPHYHVVKKFPFKRFIGNDGAINILQPEKAYYKRQTTGESAVNPGQFHQ